MPEAVGYWLVEGIADPRDPPPSLPDGSPVPWGPHVIVLAEPVERTRVWFAPDALAEGRAPRPDDPIVPLDASTGWRDVRKRLGVPLFGAEGARGELLFDLVPVDGVLPPFLFRLLWTAGSCEGGHDARFAHPDPKWEAQGWALPEPGHVLHYEDRRGVGLDWEARNLEGRLEVTLRRRGRVICRDVLGKAEPLR